MDKLEILKELTSADVQFLPKAVLEAIVAESDAAKVVAGLRSVLGDDVKIVATVTEMQKKIREMHEGAIKAAVQAEINDQVLHNAPETDRVKRARAMVARVVEMPASADGAKAAVEKAVTLEEVQAYLKDVVVIESGSNMERRTGTKPGEKTNDTGESTYLEPMPEQPKD